MHPNPAFRQTPADAAALDALPGEPAAHRLARLMRQVE